MRTSDWPWRRERETDALLDLIPGNDYLELIAPRIDEGLESGLQYDVFLVARTKAIVTTGSYLTIAVD
jgi:hypothetical protein